MKNKINKLKEKGFTLIELLVVIAIIGILAGILFVAINPKEQTDKAKDAQRLRDMKSIQQALAMYNLEHGYYPKTVWRYSYSSNWTDLEDKLKPYLPKLPEDPDNESLSPTSGGYSYGYYSSGYGGSGKWYMLVLNLKNHNSIMESDGVTACNGHYFHYGNDTSKKNVITIGDSCGQ